MPPTEAALVPHCWASTLGRGSEESEAVVGVGLRYWLDDEQKGWLKEGVGEGN